MTTFEFPFPESDPEKLEFRYDATPHICMRDAIGKEGVWRLLISVAEELSKTVSKVSGMKTEISFRNILERERNPSGDQIHFNVICYRKRPE